MKAEADRKNNVYLYTTVPVCVNVRIRLAVYSIVVFVSDKKKKKKDNNSTTRQLTSLSSGK